MTETPAGTDAHPASDATAVATTLPLGRDTVSWRINGDIAPFFGASTALLLQVAHPSVAAGVAQHSDYQTDPWARLYRTLDTVLKLVFGTSDHVVQMRRRLAVSHAPVKGVRRDGARYDARDPDLALWVWATLVHTAVVGYELIHGRLPPEDRERFYQEAKLFGQASGVPRDRFPGSWGDFLAYYDHVVTHDLARTPECLDVARVTFQVPKPRLVGPIGGRVNCYLAAAMMPPRAREIYGLNWTPRHRQRFERWMRLVRPTLRAVPRRLRELPTRLVIDHDLLDRLERMRKPAGDAPVRSAA